MARFGRRGAPPVAEQDERLERYDPTEIEPRWQRRWEELGLHTTDLTDTSKPNYYLLTMWPYPSGDLWREQCKHCIPTVCQKSV